MLQIVLFSLDVYRLHDHPEMVVLFLLEVDLSLQRADWRATLNQVDLVQSSCELLTDTFGGLLVHFLRWQDLTVRQSSDFIIVGRVLMSDLVVHPRFTLNFNVLVFDSGLQLVFAEWLSQVFRQFMPLFEFSLRLSKDPSCTSELFVQHCLLICWAVGLRVGFDCGLLLLSNFKLDHSNTVPQFNLLPLKRRYLLEAAWACLRRGFRDRGCMVLGIA